jgi:hypothetical protein
VGISVTRHRRDANFSFKASFSAVRYWRRLASVCNSSACGADGAGAVYDFYFDFDFVAVLPGDWTASAGGFCDGSCRWRLQHRLPPNSPLAV